MQTPPSSNLETAGFVLQRDVVNAQSRTLLLRMTSPTVVPGAVHRAGSAFAARGLLQKVPELRRELGNCGIDALASEALGDRAVPIDAMFFDKHARANWAVPGHQDRVVAVASPTTIKHRIRQGLAYAELTEGAPAVVATADGFVAFPVDWELEGDHLATILKQCGADPAKLREWKKRDWI